MIVLMAPVGLTAQKMYMSSGKLILDMTEAAGMPSGVQTTVQKFPNAGSSYNPSDQGTAMANNTENGSINALVYAKLEIAASNVNTSAVLATGDHLMSWATAFLACKNLNVSGRTGWRLPTQRELMVMSIFKPAAEALLGANFRDYGLWSITETDNQPQAWTVNFRSGTGSSSGNGATDRIAKTTSNLYQARCVREATELGI